MVRTIDPNGLLQDKGLTSEVYSSPPLGLSPSLLSLKGTLLKNLQCLETLSGIYIYIYIYIQEARVPRLIQKGFCGCTDVRLLLVIVLVRLSRLPCVILVCLSRVFLVAFVCPEFVLLVCSSRVFLRCRSRVFLVSPLCPWS
jgi:hypothetical protein